MCQNGSVTKKSVKGLDSRGKLTNKIIDRLQYYYDILIRNNANNLAKMKKAASAVLIILRGLKKNQQDTEENTEGTLYEPGKFVE